jgi:hypothetical protein
MKIKVDDNSGEGYGYDHLWITFMPTDDLDNSYVLWQRYKSVREFTKHDTSWLYTLENDEEIMIPDSSYGDWEMDIEECRILWKQLKDMGFQEG